MKIAVIGAGNGGQAISAYCAMRGEEVFLYDRSQDLINDLSAKKFIRLKGQIQGKGEIYKFTTDLSEAIVDADVVMIVTTADAHGILANNMAPYLKNEQVIILNPGRTGGALEFKANLKKIGFNKRIYIAEAQTLVYASRINEVGVVNIIGVKENVLLSALPSSDTSFVIDKIKGLYDCFKPAKNVLVTSLENIGAIFHPSVVLFNAAAIERGDDFYFYKDMTPSIAEFIEKVDAERLSVGKSYGIDLISAKDWVSFAYGGIKGDSLCERMKNNPAYSEILAPHSLYCRQILEDMPTGFVPLLEFGRLAGIEMPIFNSVLHICSELLKIDFVKTGRTLDKMGLSGCHCVDDILKEIY